MKLFWSVFSGLALVTFALAGSAWNSMDGRVNTLEQNRVTAVERRIDGLHQDLVVEITRRGEQYEHIKHRLQEIEGKLDRLLRR